MRRGFVRFLFIFPTIFRRKIQLILVIIYEHLCVFLPFCTGKKMKRRLRMCRAEKLLQYVKMATRTQMGSSWVAVVITRCHMMLSTQHLLLPIFTQTTKLISKEKINLLVTFFIWSEKKQNKTIIFYLLIKSISADCNDSACSTTCYKGHLNLTSHCHSLCQTYTMTLQATHEQKSQTKTISYAVLCSVQN